MSPPASTITRSAPSATSRPTVRSTTYPFAIPSSVSATPGRTKRTRRPSTSTCAKPTRPSASAISASVGGGRPRSVRRLQSSSTGATVGSKAPPVRSCQRRARSSTSSSSPGAPSRRPRSFSRVIAVPGACRFSTASSRSISAKPASTSARAACGSGWTEVIVTSVPSRGRVSVTRCSPARRSSPCTSPPPIARESPPTAVMRSASRRVTPEADRSDMRTLPASPHLELHQPRTDRLHVVTARPPLLDQVRLAPVAADALLEVDGRSTDRAGRTVVLAHLAVVALLHAPDTPERDERPHGQRGPERTRIAAVEARHERRGDQERRRDRPQEHGRAQEEDGAERLHVLVEARVAPQERGHQHDREHHVLELEPGAMEPVRHAQAEALRHDALDQVLKRPEGTEAAAEDPPPQERGADGHDHHEEEPQVPQIDRRTDPDAGRHVRD